MSQEPAKTGPPRGPAAAVIVALRPKHWVKNLFVLGPLLFSRRMGDGAVDREAGLAFLAFCLASSAVYVINDILDYEADRQHPLKRRRPIASGEIPRSMALVLAALLAAGAVALGMKLGPIFLSLLLAYVALNVSYSLGLKHVVIVDVMMIGGGFVLRVLGGTAAIGVSPSHWLVLCTILLAVFLGFTKRRAELAMLEDKASDARRVLDSYSPVFLDQMIAVVTAATLMCYILYTVDPRTVEQVAGGSRGLLLTVPFVMYGIFRYLYIVYHREQGDSPTLALLSDKMLIAGVVLWAAAAAAVIYYPAMFQRWFT